MPKFKDFEPAYQAGGWLNLQTGENKIRIVSEYQQYGSHYDEEERSSFACIGKANGCNFCKKYAEIAEELKLLKEQSDDKPDEEATNQIKELEKQERKYKPKIQYLVWVIDRSDGNIKIMKYGYTVHLKLVELAKNAEYTFDVAPDYDITIVKSGQKLLTKYDVIPARNSTPLTEKEIEEVKNTANDLAEVIKKMKDKAMPVVDIDEENAPSVEEEKEEMPPEKDEKISF